VRFQAVPAPQCAVRRIEQTLCPRRNAGWGIVSLVQIPLAAAPDGGIVAKTCSRHGKDAAIQGGA
jgi:hypothetical protein